MIDITDDTPMLDVDKGLKPLVREEIVPEMCNVSF